jgi:hypothetical protein
VAQEHGRLWRGAAQCGQRLEARRPRPRRSRAKRPETPRFPASAFLDYEALKKYLYELETQHLREPLEENALSAPAASGETRDFRRDARARRPARARNRRDSERRI